MRIAKSEPQNYETLETIYYNPPISTSKIHKTWKDFFEKLKVVDKWEAATLPLCNFIKITRCAYALTFTITNET